MSKPHLKTKGPGLEKALGKIVHQIEHAKPVVAVGVLGKGAAREGDTLSNVELAVIQEFGLGVPERSFLRATFDRMKETWNAFAAKALKPALAGKIELTKALALIGERVKSDIKRRITQGEGIPPPNAPSTIARKGSDRPLVDSGRLVGSIDYEVRSKHKP